MTDLLAPVIIGDSPSIRALRTLIAQVASTDLPVLIHGPSGSGKELVAQSLHDISGRRGSCVAVNVCAITDSLFEAALFGHKRGAFTGAVTDAAGLLLEADGGTLFLDEISGLPLAGQAKLLRAIETRVFRPVGSFADRRSAFRVVSATNEGLEELVRRGTFRADLFHRLSGIVIELQPLGARRGDIPLLAAHFLNVTGLSAKGITITASGCRALQEHGWPGNVRELRHVIERSAALSQSLSLGRTEICRSLQHGHTGRNDALDFVQRNEMLEMMTRYGWDTAAAARGLGVHRGTIYRWLHRLGIQLPQQRRSLLAE